MSDRKARPKQFSAARIEPLEARQLLSANWSIQDQQINLDKARANYPTITGAGETVAIIDEGTDTHNPDFAGKVVYSWNFDNNTPDVTPYDNNAHGTGSTGQIAANLHTYNGQLYEGVAPGVNIVALRANGSYEAKAAFDWIIANRSKYNIETVNYIDFTGSVNESVTLPEMKTLYNDGVFMAGAVGNYGPAAAFQHTDHLIYTVGSVNSSNQVSGFTPRGPNLDFVAPGENVIVSWYYNGKSFDYPSNGTSWAGPQVTATGALIKQVNPNFTPVQIASDHPRQRPLGLRRLQQDELRDARRKRRHRPVLRAGKAGSVPTPTPTPPKPPTPTPTPTPTPKPVTPPTTGGGLAGAATGTTTPSAKSTPFTGKAFVAAQVIQAEKFDNGGEGVAYHDTSTQDEGNSTAFRTGAVDIGRTRSLRGVGYVGWTHPGEWLDYSISVAKTGAYAFEVRLASASSGGTYHLEIDGHNVSGSLAVPKTGAWNAFTTSTVSGISLTAGNHILRVVMDANGAGGFVGNFDSFEFQQSKAKAAVVTQAVAPIPAAPANLSVTTVSGSQLLLNWLDTSNDETGYMIERATSPGGTYALVAVVDATAQTRRHTGTRSYVDTGLKAGTTYYYRVMSINTTGDSAAVSGSGTTRKSK